jgi:hypothetical protein
MMLSPQAARMGCHKTTLRHIGRNSRRYSAAVSHRKNHFGDAKSRNSLSYTRAALASDAFRWKSTMASYDDSEDEEELDRSLGRAEAAKARSVFSHEESWMINLGREDNNEWLLGPRDADEWFTGLKPSICPGKEYQRFKSRSGLDMTTTDNYFLNIC